MSFGQVFFIKFVCYLPEWACGDKTYVAVAPCLVSRYTVYTVHRAANRYVFAVIVTFFVQNYGITFFLIKYDFFEFLLFKKCIVYV